MRAVVYVGKEQLVLALAICVADLRLVFGEGALVVFGPLLLYGVFLLEGLNVAQQDLLGLIGTTFPYGWRGRYIPPRVV